MSGHNEDVSETVTSLLRRMSLQEKVLQLCCIDPSGLFDDGELDESRLADKAPGGIGHFVVFGEFGRDAETLRERVARLKTILTQRSPSGIEPLVHAEALNGFIHPAGSQFPTPLGLASTWHPALIEQMADITRRQMRDFGILHALSPNLDLARDPRWGRVHETYGEDPEFVAAMAVAFVKGLQGDDLRSGVAATAKHFIGYGASQGGLNHGAVQLGVRTLREEYARPFEWAIRQAGLSAVMNSYSEIDGVPTARDRSILTDLLRDQLGFAGIVVSDYFSVAMLKTLHGVANTLEDAGVMAVRAGLDVEYPEPDAFADLAEAVESGKLEEAVIDQAAGRVLRLKEKLGILPARRIVPSLPPLDPTVADALSHRLAEEGLVLLATDGTLPLKHTLKRVALVGSLIESARIHHGGYSAAAASEFSLADMTGTTNYIGSNLLALRKPIDNEVQRFEAGVRELDARATTLLAELSGRLPQSTTLVSVPLGGPDGTTEIDLEQVSAAVEGADVAVVLVGERTGWAGVFATSGEGRDRRSLDLPGDQDQLIQAVAATGVPTVVVLVSGRPLDLTRAVEHARTILFAPLLSTNAPRAIASALVGDVVPSGRLPITWPRTIGQIPLFARSRMGSGYQHPDLPVPGYVDGVGTPLFAFGHGESYTTFEYSNLVVSPVIEIVDGWITAEVTVTNAGGFDADEVVQVYARDRLASVTRPVQQLLAFARVHISVGESSAIRFRIPADSLALADDSARLVIEPGEVSLYVGGSSSRLPLSATVRLVGALLDVDSTAGSRPFNVQVGALDLAAVSRETEGMARL